MGALGRPSAADDEGGPRVHLLKVAYAPRMFVLHLTGPGVNLHREWFDTSHPALAGPTHVRDPQSRRARERSACAPRCRWSSSSSTARACSTRSRCRSARSSASNATPLRLARTAPLASGGGRAAGASWGRSATTAWRVFADELEESARPRSRSGCASNGAVTLESRGAARRRRSSADALRARHRRDREDPRLQRAPVPRPVERPDASPASPASATAPLREAGPVVLTASATPRCSSCAGWRRCSTRASGLPRRPGR